MSQTTQKEGKQNGICGIALYVQKDEAKWYIDSGCTKHMTENKRKFITLKKERGGDVSFGDDRTLKFSAKERWPLKEGLKPKMCCM